MRRLIIAACAVSLGATAHAAPPALTVVIAVDGLSNELYDAHRSRLGGGFARLATGVRFDLEGGDPLIEGLSAAVERGRPGSQTMIVSGSPQLATRLADAGADQRWTFSGGRFEQSGTANNAIAAQANAAIGQAIAAPLPALEAPPDCASPPLPGKGQRFARSAGDLNAYVSSPQLDGATLAFGVASARTIGLGSSNRRSDVLAAGLASTAAVASAYGAGSQEMCLNLRSLDRELSDVFAYLDRSGIDYAVVLAGVSAKPAPLLFWRRGWVSPVTGGPAKPADIVPTIAAMTGAPVAATETGGKCLEAIPGLACPR